MSQTAPTPAAEVEPFPPRQRYLNRETSWLAFNERVLALSEDPARPLLERIKFLAIFGSNLDEFFQVRVAGLQAQSAAGLGRASPDGRTPREQLAEIRERVEQGVARAAAHWREALAPALAREGVRICRWDALDGADRETLTHVFEEQVFPTLTPLAVDPAHPFPYISDLSLNIAVLMTHPGQAERRFARIKVPPLLPRFVPLADGERFVPLEQLIAAHLDALFPGMEVLSSHFFRVTRDADLSLEENDAEDLLVALESELHRRRRGSDAVRLEIERDAPEEVCSILLGELELEERDLYRVGGLLDLSGLWGLHELERPDLKDDVWVPQTPRSLVSEDEPVDFFSLLDRGEVLVHHPYDSFSSSVHAFLEQAAADPDVLAIKHTLYRTSGAENSIVDTLVRAAESGKQVVTLVELKARFDERNNIEWARTLEQAGVHVVYGLVGLKTHAKAALVVRREGDHIRRYCHVGTGNYNPATASGYEDVGVLSASEDLGADLGELFNYLTGCSRQRHYRKILVAPEALRRAFLDLIEAEADQPDGEIAIKVNHLSDPATIDTLYEASRRGTRIDLVVRGICGLRPGVPGLSENIRVRSILGRFLEHSRIFRFGSEARGRRYFVGSADLMQRKLDHRVELVIPVEAPALRARTEEILNLALADDGLAWELAGDGTWSRVPCVHDLRSQDRLQELARRRAAGESGGFSS